MLTWATLYYAAGRRARMAMLTARLADSLL
jgi:hypothetical protein